FIFPKTRICQCLLRITASGPFENRVLHDPFCRGVENISTVEQIRPEPAVRQRLKSLSFSGYLLMTFLSAVKHRMFGWLMVRIGTLRLQQDFGLTVKDAETLVLSLGLGCFMLPCVLFAPWAGWAADRFSKRSSII